MPADDVDTGFQMLDWVPTPEKLKTTVFGDIANGENMCDIIDCATAVLFGLVLDVDSGSIEINKLVKNGSTSDTGKLNLIGEITNFAFMTL